MNRESVGLPGSVADHSAQKEEAPAHCEVEENFRSVQSAIEQNDYTKATELLEQQRALLLALPNNEMFSLKLVERAQEVLRASLSIIALQRQTYTESLSTILQLKQMDAGYRPNPVYSQEFVSYSG